MYNKIENASLLVYPGSRKFLNHNYSISTFEKWIQMIFIMHKNSSDKKSDIRSMRYYIITLAEFWLQNVSASLCVSESQSFIKHVVYVNVFVKSRKKWMCFSTQK